MDQYQQYIHLSRYSRWIEEEQRRESWDETVDRYMKSVQKKAYYMVSPLEFPDLRDAILNLEVMPSMRMMMTAGPALDKENIGAFNCGYVPIENPKDFADLMYILMNGTGVGFSAERQHTNRLPFIPNEIRQSGRSIDIGDSRLGWCESYSSLISSLYAGEQHDYDTSRIRAKGARLKTTGGRASGPQPLIDLFEFTISTFKAAQGRQLTAAECHEICCKIAHIVVVGGVRRSALISLSNLSDPRMRDIKKGDLSSKRHLYLSNNSVCYTEKPDVSIYLQEMQSLYESKSGERGIFNRQAAKNIAARNGRRNIDHDFGTNPCSEIILRPRQFCNLTEVVVRPTDTMEDLIRKVKQATILGTLQSTFTNFNFIDPKWKENTEEERLLGVSLTGIMDHPVLSGETPWDLEGGFGELPDVLLELKEIAIETNRVWAEKLNIPVSTAITCVKPSGTVSQLVDSSSGIHDRYAPYYIRRVKGDIKDPLTQVMIEQGIPYEVSVSEPDNEVVFTFPKKAPTTSKYTTALEKFELWQLYQDHWCEHKPSVTINYKDSEYLTLIAKIYDSFDVISGISLLPSEDMVYTQAPYEEITEEEYNVLLAKVPDVNLAEELAKVEQYDTTEAAQQLSCSAGVCDI